MPPFKPLQIVSSTEKPKVYFESMRVRQLFKYEVHYYMRIYIQNNDFNALCLHNGNVCHIFDKTEVTPVNGKLIIEE